MRPALYHLSGISHFYGEKKVLDIDDLKIPSGSILGVSGPNGSGKSTLLKLLAFAMAPSQGEVRFNNHIEGPFSPRIRSKVTLLTQKPYLLKRSVFDNVAYGLKIRKDQSNLKKRVKQALASVGMDYQEFYQRRWHELSGGESQRVAMAARLILRPEALLLDEPVASVDTESAQLIRQASLAARNDWGCTLVIVSHDLAWLHECSDTRISMAGGRIFSTGEESIIPPPYTEGIDGLPVKDIGYGEMICLSPRDNTEMTAVIEKKKIHISLYKEDSNGYDNQVTALVSSMLYEKKSGHILTSLDLTNQNRNGFSLTLSFPPKQAEDLKLRPGKKIILMFKSRDITWR